MWGIVNVTANQRHANKDMSVEVNIIMVIIIQKT